jgi:ribosomal-protein-alanine N-acetyltransferase
MHTLETERLWLRPFHQEDLAEVIGWTDAEKRDAAAEAQAFLDSCFREYRQGRFGPWAMELKETKRIADNCGFPHVRPRDGCGEVNYFVAPQYRGLGLAPEALKALVEYGFEQLGLRRIEARCELDNVGSGTTSAPRE